MKVQAKDMFQLDKMIVKPGHQKAINLILKIMKKYGITSVKL